MHIPAESCVDVYRAVMDAGEKHGIANAGNKIYYIFNNTVDCRRVKEVYQTYFTNFRLTNVSISNSIPFIMDFIACVLLMLYW